MENRDNKRPLVSVIVTTYNQEKYIEACIQGILEQKVSFEYELLIGDDCSTDSTTERLRTLRKRYPEKIRLFRNKQNVGEALNTCRLLKKCIGKYIAVCEGDDYWTYPYKLERQVAFLEENPQYIGTAHNVICVDRKGRKLPIKKVDFPLTEAHTYTKENALNYEELGQMSSYVYRNIWKDMMINDFQLFVKCRSNTDIKLNATLGNLGKVYFFEGAWSCRRRLFQGDGWTAFSTSHNMQDYIYANCLNVKKYVKKRFGREMKIANFLFEVRKKALLIFLKSPSRNNLSIILKIYKLDGKNPIKAVFDIKRICMELVLEKIFGKAWLKKWKLVRKNIKKYQFYSPRICFVSDNKKCVYIQNPKVACSSIKAALYPSLPNISDYKEIHNHLLEKEYKITEGEKFIIENSDKYSFTFVRNPYERLVSCYVDKCVQNKNENYFGYYYFLEKFQYLKSFTEFICRVCMIPDRLADHHFRSQHCITHDLDGTQIVDFIGKYEDLEEEFKAIALKYNLTDLEWYHKSAVYDWREYYSIFTAVIVFIRFHKDFRLLGYEKEPGKLFAYFRQKMKET